jgi:hypothetical protein
LLEIRTGLDSFIAGVIEDNNGLIILICFGTSGTASLLFTVEMECEELLSESIFGDTTNRIVGGEVEFEDIVRCCVFGSADLVIEKRITRALFVNEEVISFVV